LAGIDGAAERRRPSSPDGEDGVAHGHDFFGVGVGKPAILTLTEPRRVRLVKLHG
jgi:hypothetical protein